MHAHTHAADFQLVNFQRFFFLKQKTIFFVDILVGWLLVILIGHILVYSFFIRFFFWFISYEIVWHAFSFLYLGKKFIVNKMVLFCLFQSMRTYWLIFMESNGIKKNNARQKDKGGVRRAERKKKKYVKSNETKVYAKHQRRQRNIYFINFYGDF